MIVNSALIMVVMRRLVSVSSMSNLYASGIESSRAHLMDSSTKSKDGGVY